MRKLLLTLFISIFCVFNMSAQTFITPNNAELGETLTVFISGNSQSNFGTWSNTDYVFLAIDPWGMGYPEYTIQLENNAFNNWQWNSSIGSYGFYSTLTLPADYWYLQGYSSYNYDLYVQTPECCENWTIYPNAFVLNATTTPNITAINPQGGSVGQNLGVNISGNNLDLGDQWSPTSNFRFSQYSGANSFYGTIYEWYDDCGNNQCQYISGSVHVPSNQPSGMYDLEVWDGTLNDWVMLAMLFRYILHRLIQFHQTVVIRGRAYQYLLVVIVWIMEVSGLVQIYLALGLVNGVEVICSMALQAMRMTILYLEM